MRVTLGMRALSALIAASFVLSACGGGGHSVPGGIVSGGNSGGGASTTHGNGNVAFTIKIPRASASSRLRSPATISAGTNSIIITVNGAKPAQTFNVASTCVPSESGQVCTLNVGAPYGLDSFLVETFSGSNGTGTVLNAAATSLNVTPAGPNQATATAGAVLVVSSPADSGGSCGVTGPASGCTLREAISEAAIDASNNGNPSYTDAILFAPGISRITLASTITLSSNIVLIGPGASAPPNPSRVGAPAAASQLTIDGGGNQIFNDRYNGSFNFSMSGLTLSNGSSSDLAGGAIESFGNLAIYNMIFSGNSAPGAGSEGGAVYDEGSNTSIVASTFVNNSAEYGGAYGVEAQGATFSNCFFSNNSAFSANDDYGEGGAIYIDEPATVASSTFTSNIAGSTTAEGVSGYLNGYGGAISIDDPANLVTIVNSTFGTLSSNGNFAGGLSASDTGYGGAVYVYDDNSPGLVSSGNTFNGNTAKGGSGAFGGAIEVDLGAICSGTQGDCATAATPDTFTNNTADATDSTSGSTADGGALYDDDSSNSITFAGTTFHGNYALGGANAVALGGAVYDVCSPFFGSQLTFSNNTANDTSQNADGGAFLANGECNTPVTLSNVAFTGNTASGANSVFGGGLEVDNGTVALTNVTFTSNSAIAVPQSSALPTFAAGGGFEYANGTLGVSKARRPGQSQTRLARIALRRQAHAARIASRHSSHHSSSRAVVAASRRAKAVAPTSNRLTNVTFTSNTADGGSGGTAYGGGADLSGTITVTGTGFASNRAIAAGGSSYGGGMSFTSTSCGSLTFTGTVTNNSAVTQGGGLWAICAGTVTNSTITGNSVAAGGNGGGIYNGGLTLDGATTSNTTGNSPDNIFSALK